MRSPGPTRPAARAVPGAPVVVRSLVLVCALLGAALAVPVGAHEADPRVSTVVEDVEPSVPAGVVIAAEANIAAQLVAVNDTDQELEVLGRGGEPFLRISRRGVFANLESPEFYETSTPNGGSAAVPARLRGGAGSPRFVRISKGSSWGWYDHRLHPSDLRSPADVARPAVLGRFEVPFRYAGRPLSVRGRIEFRPLLGGFSVTEGSAPDSINVDVLQGRLPGLFLANPSGQALTVLGRDGEPFLRFGRDGAEVNAVSRTHVEDRLARGLAAGPPAATPQWTVVGGTTYSWLDARLRYPRDVPPDDALRRSQPTVVQRWAVPVLVRGARTALSGEVLWVPSEQAAARGAAQEGSRTRLLVALAAVALGLLAVAGLAVRRRAART